MSIRQKIRFAAYGLFRMHFSLPSIVAFLAVFTLIYQFFARDLVIYVGALLDAWYDQSSVWHPFIVGIAATVVTSIVFILFGILFFDWYNKCRLTGKYEAAALSSDGVSWEDWGTVKISYHPMSSSTHHTPVKLVLTMGQGDDKIILEGDGIIIDNRYLTGHYAEVSRPERRRSGSFTYEIDGQGEQWKGKYVSIDPDHSKPHVGEAKWTKR